MLLYVESIPLYVESMPLYFDRKILYFATMLGQRKGGHWCPLYKFKPPRCWGYHLRLLLPLTFHSMPSIEVDESPVHHSAPRHCHAASTGRLQNPQCGTTNLHAGGSNPLNLHIFWHNIKNKVLTKRSPKQKKCSRVVKRITTPSCWKNWCILISPQGEWPWTDPISIPKALPSAEAPHGALGQCQGLRRPSAQHQPLMKHQRSVSTNVWWHQTSLPTNN